MFERTVGLQTTNRKGELFQIGICGGCGYNVFLKFISSFRNKDRTKNNENTESQVDRVSGQLREKKKETDKRTERNEIAWQQLARMKVKKNQQKRKAFLRGQKKMLLLSMISYFHNYPIIIIAS